MKIEKITIVLSRYGASTVMLWTNLPSQFPPEVTTQNLCLEFRCPEISAIVYCHEHFPNTPIEVIDYE